MSKDFFDRGAIDRNDVPLTLIGHPYASIGMGEQMRAHASAMSAVHLNVGMYDIFRYALRDDPDYLAQVEPIETLEIGNGIRIFHINGDEVERVCGRLETMQQNFGGGYNIIVPAMGAAEVSRGMGARAQAI